MFAAQLNLDMGDLLKTGKYSDMRLVCEGRTFKVHKMVVCLQSPVLAAAIDGQFEVRPQSLYASGELTWIPRRPRQGRCLLSPLMSRP